MVMLLLAFLVVPMLVVGGASLLFAGGTGANCGATATAAKVVQPGVSTEAANSIPGNYLKWFQRAGLQYNVPWTVLAGIGKVESDDGRTTLPGVTTGSNDFGAAGPMQIGIDGASGNQWGGAPIHPALPPACVRLPSAKTPRLRSSNPRARALQIFPAMSRHGT